MAPTYSYGVPWTQAPGSTINLPRETLQRDRRDGRTLIISKGLRFPEVRKAGVKLIDRIACRCYMSPATISRSRDSRLPKAVTILLEYTDFVRDGVSR